MNDYFKIRFDLNPCTETETDVLAALLCDAGFESFEPDMSGVSAYIRKELYDVTSVNDAVAAYPFSSSIKISEELIEGKDWNEEWERNYFKPIVFDGRCVVHSSFHKDYPKAEYDIVIDPKMAFGTGNHSTTYLMISEILKLDLQGKEVLDMGCGTAVLAILARMKGASRVVAIDIDEWAYNNARENIRLNHTEDIEVGLGGAEKIAGYGTFDIIFANINRNILINDMHLYARSLRQGGLLYMSGFYTEDIPAIEAECEKNGIKLLSHSEQKNWVAVKCEKEGAKSQIKG